MANNKKIDFDALDTVADEDCFSLDKKIERVVKIIKNKDVSPYNIAIYGDWGSGKTTFLHMVAKKMGVKDLDNPSLNSDESILFVKFNAWMFESYENAKLVIGEGILKAVMKKRRFSISGLIARLVSYKLHHKFIDKLFGIGFFAVLSFLFSQIYNFLFDNPEQINKNYWGYLRIEIAVFLCFAILGIFIAICVSDFISSISAIKDDKLDLIVFRKKLSEIINKAKLNKVVIVIDELDRCSDEKIVDTLEAVKLLLDIKKTNVIVAADKNILSNAIKKRRDVDDLYAIKYVDKVINYDEYIYSYDYYDRKAYLYSVILEKYHEDISINEIRKGISEGKGIRDIARSIIGINNKVDDIGEKFCRYDNLVNLILDCLPDNLRASKRVLKQCWCDIENISDDEHKLISLCNILRIGYPDKYQAMCSKIKNMDWNGIKKFLDNRITKNSDDDSLKNWVNEFKTLEGKVDIKIIRKHFYC